MRLEALASRSDDRGFYELSCVNGAIDPAQMFEGLFADLAKGGLKPLSPGAAIAR